MLPKIIFRYSPIYDEDYRTSERIKDKLKEKGLTYPSKKEIFNRIEEVNQIWSKIGNDVLKNISKISSLKWKEKDITCYVIGFGRSFSDPLTIKLHDSVNDFIDTLVHELIHNIQIQNNEKCKKWYNYLNENYSKESVLTKNHIIVHAIHKEIYLSLFSQERLKEDIRTSALSPDYKKSWEIVEEEGHENLIKKFRKLTK